MTKPGQQLPLDNGFLSNDLFFRWLEFMFIKLNIWVFPSRDSNYCLWMKMCDNISKSRVSNIILFKGWIIENCSIIYYRFDTTHFSTPLPPPCIDKELSVVICYLYVSISVGYFQLMEMGNQETGIQLIKHCSFIKNLPDTDFCIKWRHVWDTSR